MAAPLPLPSLVDDAVEEILLRLPPDEPSCLVRASRRTSLRASCAPPSSASHGAVFSSAQLSAVATVRTPPMLCILHDSYMQTTDASVSHFDPTMEFCPEHGNRRVLDCRHGRALLMVMDLDLEPMNLIVWDPMSGCRSELRVPDIPYMLYAAAVLCAAASGCDHGACREGPFIVVFVGSDRDTGVTSSCVYSSETGEWSVPSSLRLGHFTMVDSTPSVLVGGALYFMLRRGLGILKHDLDMHCLSVVEPPWRPTPPQAAVCGGGTILMAAEDGRLGLARLNKLTIYVWWREVLAPDGVSTWTKRRVVDLRTLLPVGDHSPELVGFAAGTSTVLVTTKLRVYTIDLKSLCSRKVPRYLRLSWSANLHAFPYMSFYEPPGISLPLSLL